MGYWLLLPLLAAFGLLVWWASSRSSHYGAIFSDEHYLEVAAALPRLKAAVLETLDEPERIPAPVDDPRVLRTTGGLNLLYTVDREDGAYVHHWSVSLDTGVTPGAVGQMFTLLLADLLGFDPRRGVLTRTASSTIHHAFFSLTDSEQVGFVARPIRELTTEGIAALKDRLRAAREEVTFGPSPAEEAG